MSTQDWFLYVLECEGGHLYTGISTDVARRFAAHRRGRGARYTRIHPPLRILTVVAFPDKREAARAEYDLKQWPAARKRAFCAAHPFDSGTPEQGNTPCP